MTSCASSKTVVRLSQYNKWRDVFSNQSGEDLVLELTKRSGKKQTITQADSTKIKIVTIKEQDGRADGVNSNPGGDGISFTKNLDITLDGSTKVIVIPPGFKVIGITSQKESSIVITKGYIFSKQLKKRIWHKTKK